MFLGNDRGTELIHHTFTKPELRGRGVMQALVRYAVDSAGSPIGTSLSDSHEFAPAVMHVMEKCGFERRNGRSVYLCDGGDMWERWDAYMDKHGRRLCDTLRRQGFSTLTLDKASEDLLQQFREAPDSEYKCQQNHQHLILPGAEITPDISVICTHNGRLAAYVFAYMADRKSVIFKTLSSSAALRGSGVIMLAIADAADIGRGFGRTEQHSARRRTGPLRIRCALTSVCKRKPELSLRAGIMRGCQDGTARQLHSADHCRGKLHPLGKSRARAEYAVIGEIEMPQRIG